MRLTHSLLPPKQRKHQFLNETQSLTRHYSKRKKSWFHLLTQPSPGEATHLLSPQTANFSLVRSQRKVPGWGSGLVPPLKLEEERKRRSGNIATDRNTGENQIDVAFTPPLHYFSAFSSTTSALLIQHLSPLYIFISHSISQHCSHSPLSLCRLNPLS